MGERTAKIGKLLKAERFGEAASFAGLAGAFVLSLLLCRGSAEDGTTLSKNNETISGPEIVSLENKEHGAIAQGHSVEYAVGRLVCEGRTVTTTIYDPLVVQGDGYTMYAYTSKDPKAPDGFSVVTERLGESAGSSLPTCTLNTDPNNALYTAIVGDGGAHGPLGTGIDTLSQKEKVIGVASNS